MALRKIVVQGEECLTKVCRPVTEFNPHLHQLLDDMLETLEDAIRRKFLEFFGKIAKVQGKKSAPCKQQSALS